MSKLNKQPKFLEQEIIDRNYVRLSQLFDEYGRGMITYTQFVGRIASQQVFAMEEADKQARLNELDDVRAVAIGSTSMQTIVEHTTNRLETILNPQEPA